MKNLLILILIIIFNCNKETPAQQKYRISSEDEFFKRVLSLIDKSDTLKIESELFNLHVSDTAISYNLDGETLYFKISFGFSYKSYNDTTIGYYFYPLMPQMFIDYLTINGYQVQLYSDKSRYYNWRRKVYEVSKNGSTKFLFFYEAEHVDKSGYAYIKIIMKP